ncbi:MAG TPA: hypothetical protein DDZ39_09220 [Flavobacteriaceae bacterium]|jgi:hypothetical protein|nr:hypothetical protein [Flavobacteriaceae bacterium]HBS11190.1 hypothetical protein [Flavobacteriaceae bacterium]
MASKIILFIILAGIIAILLTYFQYYYKTKDKSKTTLFLGFLRFSSIFLVLIALINPKIKIKKYEDIKPKLNILIDNSTSIAYAKQQQNIDAFLKQLKENTILNEKFNLNYYAFADDLQLKDSFTYTFSETNIVKSLKTLQEIDRGNVAPTILVTDGNQTQGADYTFFAAKQAIYPVIVGDTLQYDDLKINQINVNSYTNLNNYFPVEVFVNYDGQQNINKTLNVYQQGKVVYKKQLTFSKEKSSQKVQFDLPANSIGIQNLRCTISTLENEKNTINNQKNFSIEVIDEQAKILILSAVNHPDISMMKRSISSNKQLKVVVENDLNKTIQFKDYQLVILYQPTIKFKNIMADIELNQINTFTITGTVTDWNFLNKSQQYFSKKQIDKTEDFTASFNTDFDEFIIENIGFADFNPLEDYFGVVSFSLPYKTLLFQNISNFSTKNPLLATFSVNNRRGAVLFGENSWKWRMQSHLKNNSFIAFDNFFSKLIQYLASSKKSSRLDIDYKPIIFANKDVVIKAQPFDANYAFVKNSVLSLTLTNKRTKEQRKIPFTLKNTHFEVVLSDLKTGDYNFSVITNDNRSKYGNFTVLPYDVEQQFTSANTKDLKSLANNSKGVFFTIKNTKSLIQHLLEDKQYHTIQKSKEHLISIINWKWLLPLILFLFSLEWFIRKYYGKI